MHVERGDHQFFQTGITGKTGQRVKHGRHFLRQLWFAGKQTEVCVNTGGARVIIPCPEMDIMPESIGIAPDDKQRFAVRFQPNYAIDDVGAGFFEPPRPLDIHRLIEAGAQFHDRGDLFSCLRRINQRLNDRRIAAGTIESDLDCQHLRVGCRFLDEFDNLIKAVVRMMQQHVLPS